MWYFMEGVIELSKEREAIRKTAKPCPDCGSEQVQIIGYSPPSWKCRKCSYKWETDKWNENEL